MHGLRNIPLNFDRTHKALVQKHGRDAAKNMFLMASNTLQEFAGYVVTRACLDPDVFFAHGFGTSIFNHLDIGGRCKQALIQTY
ncbi:hypothetical protein J3F84DRAFT_259212 [Trichoderma pleuroticola]